MTTEFRDIPHEIPQAFWLWIDLAKRDPDLFQQKMKAEIEFTHIDFYWNYQEAVLQLKSYFESTDGFSEDSLNEFCYWVVSQGQENYTRLWNKCETEIVTNMNSELRPEFDPGVASKVLRIYEERSGEDMPRKEDDAFHPMKAPGEAKPEL